MINMIRSFTFCRDVVSPGFIKSLVFNFFVLLSFNTPMVHSAVSLKFTDEEVSFLQKAERIQQSISQQKKEKLAAKRNFSVPLPKKEIVDIEIARKKYGVNDQHTIDGSMLIFHGDVYVDGDLNDAWFNKQLKDMKYEDLYGTIVLGNLYVNGSIIDDNYLYLIVQKNTEADYVESQDGLMFFNGDLKSLYGIYGEYNDGWLDVAGKVFSPYLIADDHAMPREASNEFIYVEGGNHSERNSMLIGKQTGSGIAWDWIYYEPSAHLFSNNVWLAKTDEFSVKQFFDLVRNGENPFVAIK